MEADATSGRAVLDKTVVKCICWKPTGPGHQMDCPVPRERIAAHRRRREEGRRQSAAEERYRRGLSARTLGIR